ncbi:MAG: hypothetical protein U0232_10940 [Thermomicrobiales bacterium]
MTTAEQSGETTMDAERLWAEYSSLLPKEQQQLLDLLAHLKSQRTTAIKQQFDWSKEPFIGMWSGRDDMTDGAQWIRSLRDHEWSRHNG